MQAEPRRVAPAAAAAAAAAAARRTLNAASGRHARSPPAAAFAARRNAAAAFMVRAAGCCRRAQRSLAAVFPFLRQPFYERRARLAAQPPSNAPLLSSRAQQIFTPRCHACPHHGPRSLPNRAKQRSPRTEAAWRVSYTNASAR